VRVTRIWVRFSSSFSPRATPKNSIAPPELELKLETASEPPPEQLEAKPVLVY